MEDRNEGHHDILVEWGGERGDMAGKRVSRSAEGGEQHVSAIRGKRGFRVVCKMCCGHHFAHMRFREISQNNVFRKQRVCDKKQPAGHIAPSKSGTDGRMFNKNLEPPKISQKFWN